MMRRAVMLFGGQGLFEGEAVLVEGAADDGAVAAEGGRGGQVGDGRHAARGLDLEIGTAADDLAQQVEIGAGQGAVAADVGDQQVAGEVGRIAVQRGPEVDPGRLGPALERRDPAVAVSLDVDGQGDAVRAESAQPVGYGLGLRHRQRTDHDAGDAGVDQGGDVVGGADAAAGLDADVDGAGEFADEGVLDRAPGLGAVEVDDVGPGRAGRREGGEAGGGLVIVAGDGVEPAVHQPHADPVFQVDGGIDDHAGSSRKLRRMRAPAAAERSGWNWQPQRLALRTMAGTGPP
jgi:hypothetical protein